MRADRQRARQQDGPRPITVTEMLAALHRITP
jgi:hypothetical protein